MIKHRELNLSDVLSVAKKMRQSDWEEIANLVPRPLATPEGIAMLVMQQSSVGFITCLHDFPVCVVQMVEKHDGCWSVGMFATDYFDKVWKAVYREVRCVLVPALLDAGARYCEAHVMADNKPAQAFLRSIGFTRKSAVLTNYGAFGRDFLLFTTTSEEISNVHGWRQSAGCKSAD